MRCNTFSWFLILLTAVALGTASACVKVIPLPAEERDAVATAVTRAVHGDMDLMAIEKTSLVRTAPYLRIALKILPDKAPKSRDALRAHIHSNAMAVIREVALHSSTAGISAITVEYYVNFLATPGQQQQGPERVRLVYSTGVQIEALNKHNVSTITDDQIAALVTHTTDEIRKLDLPN
jgi:hypothetical protein